LGCKDIEIRKTGVVQSKIKGIHYQNFLYYVCSINLQLSLTQKSNVIFALDILALWNWHKTFQMRNCLKGIDWKELLERNCLKGIAWKELLERNCLKGIAWKELLERNWVFAAISNFLTPISLQHNVVDLRYIKLWILFHQIKSNLSLKYERFTPTGCKDIWIIKSEFVVKTHFLSLTFHLIMIFIFAFQKFIVYDLSGIRNTGFKHKSLELKCLV